MITILRLFIVIAMLIFLVLQIYYLIREKLGKSLQSGAIVQILYIIQLILRCFE